VEAVSDTLVPCDPYNPAPCIIILVGTHTHLPANSHKFFNFRKACYSDINTFLLSFNWHDSFLTLDVDSATNTSYDASHYCIILLLSPQPGSQKT